MEAKASYRQALEIRKKLAADFPRVPAYRQDKASSDNNLGVLLDAMRECAEAEAAYRRAAAVKERARRRLPPLCRSTAGSWPVASSTQSPRQAGLRKAPGRGNVCSRGPVYLCKARHRLSRHAGISSGGGDVPQQFGLRAQSDGEDQKTQKRTTARPWPYRSKLAANFPTVPVHAVELGSSYCNFGSLLRDSGLKPEAGLDAGIEKAILQDWSLR